MGYVPCALVPGQPRRQVARQRADVHLYSSVLAAFGGSRKKAGLTCVAAAPPTHNPRLPDILPTPRCVDAAGVREGLELEPIRAVSSVRGVDSARACGDLASPCGLVPRRRIEASPGILERDALPTWAIRDGAAHARRRASAELQRADGLLILPQLEPLSRLGARHDRKRAAGPDPLYGLLVALRRVCVPQRFLAANDGADSYCGSQRRHPLRNSD